MQQLITEDLYKLSLNKLQELIQGVTVIDENTGNEKGYSRTPDLNAIKYAIQKYEAQELTNEPTPATWKKGPKK